MGFRILNVMIFSNMVGKFEKFVKITRRVEKYSNPIVKFLKLLVTSKKRNFTKEKKNRYLVTTEELRDIRHFSETISKKKVQSIRSNMERVNFSMDNYRISRQF